VFIDEELTGSELMVDSGVVHGVANTTQLNTDLYARRQHERKPQAQTP
jgi:hypothetical protein